VPDDGSEEIVHDKISKRVRLRVADGDHIDVGEKINEGTIDPHELLRVLGPRAVQVHLTQEVQEVYRSQGVQIHDKHIEIIIRQMLKRVTVIDSGSTEFLPGLLVDRAHFEAENRRVVAEGGEPAAGRPVLMGITKASLATESWLSAASFQETTRVLTDAAIHARSDSLLGLKENVIIGKLIPAGTGISRYRNVRVEPTEEAKAAAYTMTGYEDADYSFGTVEGVLTARSGPHKCSKSKSGDCFTFRNPPRFANALAHAGLTVLNSANNHSADYYTAGAADTTNALHAAGIKQAGVRGSLARVHVNGVWVAFLGFAPYDYDPNMLALSTAAKALPRAAANNDIVVVYMHAGAEGSGATHVTGREEYAFGEDRGNPRAFAHMAINCGAKRVLAGGPHGLRGMEFYRG